MAAPISLNTSQFISIFGAFYRKMDQLQHFESSTSNDDDDDDGDKNKYKRIMLLITDNCPRM
jgi:hypothetical protein